MLYVLLLCQTLAPHWPAVRLAPALGDTAFDRPLALVPIPGSTDLAVVEQDGRVWRVAQAAPFAKSLLLEHRVRRRHGEEGLLSLAFAPTFPADPRVYLYYSASNPRRTVLSRMRLGGQPLRAAPATEEVLLEVPQPYGNHNGGTVLFGPDGMLYLSLGDGGSAGDPEGHGQNLGTLLGSIVRLDVSKRGKDAPYAIPPDNPFVDRAGARPEIWAYGLRNVWRMSFDRQTGTLWAADVGQNHWEEVDVITRGGNYGWNLREGAHDYAPRNAGSATPGTLIDPVHEYDRRDGVSITGGRVYRGARIPGLAGAYVFADFGSGKVWALRYDGTRVVARVILLDTRLQISSFGEDHAGELYVTAFDGRVYQFMPR